MRSGARVRVMGAVALSLWAAVVPSTVAAGDSSGSASASGGSAIAIDIGAGGGSAAPAPPSLVPPPRPASGPPHRGGGPSGPSGGAFHREIPLPAPTLTVAPGFAIVGLDAYLEIHGPTEVHLETSALGVTIAVDAMSVYDVAWGDGTSTPGVAEQGGPWPSGALTHVYQRAGTQHLVVVQRWTARWRTVNGTGGGVIRGLATSASLDLPAREVQTTRD